jgi:hypothetical protein
MAGGTVQSMPASTTMAPTPVASSAIVLLPPFETLSHEDQVRIRWLRKLGVITRGTIANGRIIKLQSIRHPRDNWRYEVPASWGCDARQDPG